MIEIPGYFRQGPLTDYVDRPSCAAQNVITIRKYAATSEDNIIQMICDRAKKYKAVKEGDIITVHNILDGMILSLPGQLREWLCRKDPLVLDQLRDITRQVQPELRESVTVYSGYLDSPLGTDQMDLVEKLHDYGVPCKNHLISMRIKDGRLAPKKDLLTMFKYGVPVSDIHEVSVESHLDELNDNFDRDYAIKIIDTIYDSLRGKVHEVTDCSEELDMKSAMVIVENLAEDMIIKQHICESVSSLKADEQSDAKNMPKLNLPQFWNFSSDDNNLPS